MENNHVKEWIVSHQKKLAIGAFCAAMSALLLWGGLSVIGRMRAVSAADEQMEKASAMLAEVLVPEEDGPDASGEALSDPDLISLKDADAKYAAGLEAHETDPYMRKRIDFDKLSAMVASDDVYGWLTVPETEIDYVVMQGTNEEPAKYLWQDMYGEKSKTGCLFVQGALGADRDDHTVIYGHRLKDHSLFFGPLLSFRDAEHAKAHSYAYTYDAQKVTKWELAYVCEGKEEDAVYYFPYAKGTDEWTFLDQDIAAKAVYENGNVGAEDDMLVLSTCSGRSAGRPERLYLVYRDVAYYVY